MPGTSIEQLYEVKQFDDELRLFLLRHITHVEEEVRTLTGYKFDQCNNDGKITWYDANAYSAGCSLQERMGAISSAYSELSKSQLDYVKFYMKNHEQIPTWIMIKVVNFSTFINVLKCSKTDVTHSLCKLYGMYDEKGYPDVKLLIGSLHWLRKIRNACAHNERIFCMRQNDSGSQHSGRIKDGYILALRKSYQRESSKLLFDLLVYFKYYLPDSEYREMIGELKCMMLILQKNIAPNAFHNVRGSMGIKDMMDLDMLVQLQKAEIDYNKFDSRDYHLK